MASLHVLTLSRFDPSPPRWCTAAANVDKQPQINIIEFCVWGPPRKIQTTLSTSLRMRGGETSFMNKESSFFFCFLSECFVSLCWKPPLLLRSMHYPPETSSIMLMARMVAVVKQVRYFSHHCCLHFEPALYLSVVGLSLASIQRKLLTNYSKCFSDADKYETTMATVLLLNAGYVMKAKDKDHWQKLFSHFCNRAANEEEEIAHKLLGEQFRVSLLSGHICLIYERVSVSTAPWKYPGIVIPSGWSCCSHRAADVIIFFIQGQLALLHNLFKAALYDDDLSRVRDKSCDL